MECVGDEPCEIVGDALNEHTVTLPEGISKERWLQLNNKVSLLYGLKTDPSIPSIPLPGTGNQNEQYGNMGNDVWE